MVDQPILLGEQTIKVEVWQPCRILRSLIHSNDVRIRQMGALPLGMTRGSLGLICL